MSTGVLVAVGTAPFEAALLEAAGSGDLHVVRRCVDVADLLASAATRQADVAIVSAQLRGLDTDVIARLQEESVTVLGLTPDAASADEAILLRFGVTAIGDAGRLSDLAGLVAEVVADSEDASAVDHWTLSPSVESPEIRTTLGQLIAVWGPTGAPGRSVVSVGLASELAALGLRTMLIDADVYGGAVAAMLGLLDESSGLLASARAANRGELQPDLLVRQARAVNPTLRVLTGLPRADRWVEVGTVLMRRVLETATRVSELTVVDCGFNLELDEELSYDTSAPRRNGATVEVLTRADIVVVVGGADAVSLGRLIRGIHDLSMVAPGVAPYVLVNRVRSGGWSGQEITAMVTRATGVGQVGLLPDDPAACDRALVHGKTLTECAPDAKLTKALRHVAAELVGAPEPANLRRRRARRAR
jgi:MinD-like ATPase involved in chromosome partitioning or flagellar assembly